MPTRRDNFDAIGLGDMVNPPESGGVPGLGTTALKIYEQNITDILLTYVLNGDFVTNLRKFVMTLNPDITHFMQATMLASHMMNVIRTKLKDDEDLSEALMVLIAWCKMHKAPVCIHAKDFEGYPICQETLYNMQFLDRGDY